MSLMCKGVHVYVLGLVAMAIPVTSLPFSIAIIGELLRFSLERLRDRCMRGFNEEPELLTNSSCCARHTKCSAHSRSSEIYDITHAGVVICTLREFYV